MDDDSVGTGEMLGRLQQARESAVARRRGLAEEIAKIDRLLGHLDRALNDLGQAAEAPTRVRKPGPVSVIKPAIEDILKNAAGAPLHATAILEQVRAKGIPVSEKDPKATIVTALIRMDRARDAAGAKEGVQRMGHNQFRWITEERRSVSTEPQLPFERSPYAPRHSVSEPEPSRP